MPQYFDNTCLQCLQRCPRSYYYRHVLHLVPLLENRTALTFGQAIHKGLELGYKAMQQGLQSIEIKNVMLQGFQEEYKKLQIFDKKRSIENGTKMLEDYCAIYLPEPFEVLTVESMVSKEILTGIFYCGKIDLTVKLQTGEKAVIDHKTSSSMKFCLHPNHQVTGYNLITNTTKAFINLLGVYVLNTAKRKEEKFLRPSTERGEVDFQKFQVYLYDAITRIDLYTEQDSWPMSGNCFDCPYTILCNCELKEAEEQLQKTMFKQEPWEPWKEDK